MGTDFSLLPKDYLIHIILFGSNMCNTISKKSIIELYVKNTNHFRVLEAFSLI